MKHFTIPFALIVLAFAGFSYWDREIWPIPYGEKYSKLGSKYAIEYKKTKFIGGATTAIYVPSSDYLGYGSKAKPRTSPTIQLDEQGLPMNKSGKEFVYNPVTLGQYALAEYGRYLKSSSNSDFLLAVDKLVSLQRTDGAFPYDLRFRHYTALAQYRPGWVSGMAQGVALSALARALLVTGDEKYRISGDRALLFLDIPKDQLGPRTSLKDLHPSLDDYLFYMEYQTEPTVYTLNGFMFTLIGLYDWWRVADSNHAKHNFFEGMRTLEKILPYFDLGTFSSYDLSYVTHPNPAWLPEREPHIAARYHKVHLDQLQLLGSIYPSDILKQYLAKWSNYVK